MIAWVREGKYAGQRASLAHHTDAEGKCLCGYTPPDHLQHINGKKALSLPRCSICEFWRKA